MSLIFIFLDGVGYGENDPDVNPWSQVESDSFIAIKGRPPTYPGVVWTPLDATLGVPGLPQSATGTTSLLTGFNAQAALGCHLSGFPNVQLRRIITAYSIHKQILALGKKPTFANAYNEAYFRRPMSRQSVTTHAAYAAMLPFRMMDDYRRKEAVFHDLTGELIFSQGNENKLKFPQSVRIRQNYIARDDTFAALLRKEPTPILTPEEAGAIIVKLAQSHDFVLFEYVKTDLAGHAQDIQWAYGVVDEVMRFLRTIARLLDLDFHTLLVASDHGNSEDLSVKNHTYNPVPAAAVGKDTTRLLESCSAITDLVPNILRFMEL